MHFQHLSKIALAISVAFLSAGASAESNQVYSETVSGHNAPMTVDVIMKDGAIKNILVDDRESPGAGKKAIAILKKQILENQTVNLDAVTGATITSSSFVSAVSANLKKSGVDLKKFSKEIPAKELNDKYESQVVIIGGGGAGLAAAASAIEAGGNVIIIEKLGFLGGSSAVSGGGFAYTNWLETFIRAYPKQVQIFTDTTAEKLIEDKSGRVIGVEAEHNGKKVTFTAQKGVIITTGGFASNVELRQKLNTGPWKEKVLDSSIGSTNSFRASQGDGLKLAKDVGADLIDLDYIQLHPGGTPGTGIMSSWPSGRNRIFVNVDGARFVNEDAPRDELCKAIFAQPQSKYWVVMNKMRLPNKDTVIGGMAIGELLQLGKAYKADTIEGLAKVTGMKADKLKASIDMYNEVVTGKVKKDRFGFTKSMASDAPFTEGPYFATMLVPAVHHTMGGIRINVKTQVLDANGKIIPGLYAAGEVTGGVHGDNRVGGNGIADAMVFGKRAGQEAMK